MAEADAKPPPKSDPDSSPIASICPSSPSSGGGDALAIENQLVDLAIGDELPNPSGWEEGPVPGGGDEVSGEKLAAPAAGADSRPRFPRRPGEPDCTYYVKFGSCRFGMKCKFNHPARKKKNRVKGSGNSGSGSNSSSNKASSPDDEQTPKEEYEGLVPDNSVEIDSLVIDVKKGRMEPKELKIAEETERGIYLKKLDEADHKAAKEKRKEIISVGSAQEECKANLYFGSAGSKMNPKRK